MNKNGQKSSDWLEDEAFWDALVSSGGESNGGVAFSGAFGSGSGVAVAGAV